MTVDQTTNRTVFVTGMQRSGTTLTDKLLAAHPDIRIYSQPFPMLFVDAKRSFLGARRLDTAYPLEHYFGQAAYSLEAFTDFLRGHKITRASVESVLQEMRTFSGQYTKIDDATSDKLLEGLPTAEFAGLLTALLSRLGHDHRPTQYVGSKETLCEEFIPYLLAADYRVVLVIRDPRDVICSLNYGKGTQWAGSLKPTLFNLRHWRKSVALALTHQQHPHLAVVRYEDLVRDPVVALGKITTMMELATVAKDDLAEVIGDPSSFWQGNSSFGALAGVSTGAVGRFEDVLPKPVRDYIEATCLPELKAMGYETRMSLADCEKVITGFKEPYQITRPGLIGYSEDPKNVELELERVHSLLHQVRLDDPSIFLTAVAGRKLAQECLRARL